MQFNSIKIIAARRSQNRRSGKRKEARLLPITLPPHITAQRDTHHTTCMKHTSLTRDKTERGHKCVKHKYHCTGLRLHCARHCTPTAPGCSSDNIYGPTMAATTLTVMHTNNCCSNAGKIFQITSTSTALDIQTHHLPSEEWLQYKKGGT